MSTPLLGLALPTDGTTNWGTLVNTSVTALIDSAVAGTTTLSVDADATLSTTVEAANQARQAVLLCTGARTAVRRIVAPAQSKTYVVINATTGGYGVTISGTGPTTGVTVPAGKAMLVAWSGSDFVSASSTTINLAVDVVGVLPVANGGTNASTASGARTNLGLGTIATQDASTVAITGGAISGTAVTLVSEALPSLAQGQIAYNTSSNTLSVGRSADTVSLATVTTAQTLTNKTLTSPILVTPALGTPASGTLTNCTSLPIDAGTTGTLPVARGGTGATSAASALTNLGAYPASNPSGYTSNTGTVTSITAGTGLSGGTITSTGTIALADTAVSAGSYTNANITVDAQGRITSAANGSASAPASITSVGAIVTAAIDTSSVLIPGATVSGANCYYLTTTPTFGFGDVYYSEGAFTSYPSTIVSLVPTSGRGTLSQGSTIREVTGNVGYSTPGGHTALSGTWRVLTPVSPRSSAYDSGSGRTTSTTYLALIERVS